MPPIPPKPQDKIGEEALQIEKNLAQKALLTGDRDTAWQHLYSVVKRLSDFPAASDRDALFTSTAIELANVSFVLGKGFPN